VNVARPSLMSSRRGADDHGRLFVSKSGQGLIPEEVTNIVRKRTRKLLLARRALHLSGNHKTKCASPTPSSRRALGMPTGDLVTLPPRLIEAEEGARTRGLEVSYTRLVRGAGMVLAGNGPATGGRQPQRACRVSKRGEASRVPLLGQGHVPGVRVDTLWGCDVALRRMRPESGYVQNPRALLSVPEKLGRDWMSSLSCVELA
jgi:hypothetical protein